MDNPLISVIVPVYNVERHLHQCVQSILKQSYENFELILVDDGSPDGCGAICDEYAGKDKRVKAVHKTNGGLSSARNAGMDISSGKYLAFIDSDDTVEADYLRALAELISSENTALAICGFHSVNEDGIPIPGRESISDEGLEGTYPLSNHVFWKLFNSKRIGSCWDKLYCANYIHEYNLRFREDVTAIEDTDFVLRYLRLIPSQNRVAVTNAQLYNYFTSEHGSLMHKLDEHRWDMFEIVFPQLAEYTFSENAEGEEIQSLNNYVCSAAHYTIDAIFRYSPDISLRKFRVQTSRLFQSSYYQSASASRKHTGKGIDRLFAAGNSGAVWAYYKLAILINRLLTR